MRLLSIYPCSRAAHCSADLGPQMIKKMQAGSDTAKTEIEEGQVVPPPPREQRRPLESQALPDDFKARPKKHRK